MGRIGRNADGKIQTIVYDYVDIKVGLFAHQFQMRLKGYKKDGYKLFNCDEKLNLLYSYNNYSSKLIEDIETADEVYFYCNYFIEERMNELLALNKNIKLITDIKIDYTNIDCRHSEINAIVINNEIIWYGSINPYSWAKKDDTILRLVDKEYVE